MLNIGKLRKGGELYYLNSVARGVEDYYVGSGEAPGYWLASGAKDLGLTDAVGETDLRAVLTGFHPHSSNRLTNSHQSKRERVPGFDLTFRAPKSVSLLHALGPKEASNHVVSAHDAAVEAALAYLEREASAARRGKGGKDKIASKGFIGAAFRHRTSRAGDPLLHTHVLVANLIQGEDGRWGALDARRLYVHAKTAGYLYQAHLRAELSRRLGIEWSPVRNGTADISGVSREVIRAFSKRRSEVEAMVGGDVEGRPRAAEVAAVRTRKAKDYRVNPPELLPEWRRRADRLGLDSDALGRLIGCNNYRRPTTGDLHRIESQLAASEGLTGHSSTFSRRDAIQGFCEYLKQGATVEDVEHLADAFLSSESVIPLSARMNGLTVKNGIRVSDGRLIPAGNDERRYSTADMLEVEQAVVERSIARRLGAFGVASEEHVEHALSMRPSLFEDQRAMVRRLTTSGLGVEVVVGKAGSGKTFALDAGREAWSASGYRVIGCALSARAAQELQAGAGVESYTIAALLRDLDHPITGGFAGNTVVIVDEAGMVGTRSLDHLLDHGARAGAKVVLVGDDHQLPEIDAGGAFRGIKNRLPSIELSEVRRQPFGWERDALELIRDGRAEEAIAAYVGHDRVVVGATSEETRRQLVNDWWETRGDDEPAVMIAARRSDADDLNSRARRLLIAVGTIDKTNLDIGGRLFAKGDRVMTTRNDRGLGVINGARAVVQKVDCERKEITIRKCDGSSVLLPQSYLDDGHLTHSYAITGHKAQGMTADKAYVLGDETLYREWTYTAMSRGRNDNRLYVVAGADPDRDELGGEVAPPTDPMAELVRAIGRSRAKDLALDVYEHQEIRDLSYRDLRREWDSLRAIMARMPQDPSAELGRVRRAGSELQDALQGQRHAQQTAMRALHRMGAIGRWRNRADSATLKRRITEATASEARVFATLERLQHEERETLALKRRRDQWLVANALTMRRFDAVGRELWWREQQVAIAAEVAMPQYLKRAVGERPLPGSEQAPSREVVHAVDSCQEPWGANNKGKRGLGGEADNRLQADKTDAAKKGIVGVAEPARETEVDLIERSIEL